MINKLIRRCHACWTQVLVSAKSHPTLAWFMALLHADGSVHLIRCAVVWNDVDLGCKHVS